MASEPSRPQSAGSFHESVAELAFGKRLPTAIYVFDDPTFELPETLRTVTDRLRKRLSLGSEFNIIKFSTVDLRCSFLSYPDFFDDPHPVLTESVSIDLATAKARRIIYRDRSNPPILHRKEAFLPDSHPEAERFRRLTDQEEGAGLYEKTATIGFKLNWERLLAEKGLGYRGHELISVEPAGDGPLAATEADRRIDRHRTALSRADLSKPVKCLLDHGLIRQTETFFDYGCGLGDDVAGLSVLGYAASGWDPHFAPDADKSLADVVNLGFVLNVIEDPAERVEVLVDAWEHTRKLLIVSTLITGRESYSYAEAYADGLVTVRNTFQKHFEPTELTGLIEQALHAEPIPVELGICYVFRHVDDQQDFLSRRTQRIVDWEQIHSRLRLLRPQRVRLSAYDRHPELLDDFWKRLIELGRAPKPAEYLRSEDLRAAGLSINQAVRLFAEKFGEEPLADARRRRKEDLLVYLAAGEFQKRRTPFAHLSEGLRTDIKSFFGHYAGACDEARALLFAAGDSDEIEAAMENLEFGWFDGKEGHFTIHRSLIDRLPPILRIYIECAARLFGDPRQADLIKLHVYSGKLTFQHYDDFDGKALPELVTRIKIDLRRLFVSVIDHAEGPVHQILFFKERFLPTDYPGREAMERYSKRLRKLGITETMLGSNDTGAPSREEFESALKQVGLTQGLARKPVPPKP